MKRIFLLLSFLTTFYSLISAQTIYVDIYDTICSNIEGRYWNGERLMFSGVYSDTTTTADGRDSITTLYLEACYCPYTIVDAYICEDEATQRWPDYVPGSNSYSYTEKEPQNGCFHVYEVSYYVYIPKYTYDTVYTDECILPFYWRNHYVTECGVYCHNLPAPYGQERCPDQECLVVLPSRTGLGYTESHKLTITPNPVKPQELLTIDCPLIGSVTIEFVGATGIIVQSQIIGNLPCRISAPTQSGLYIVRVTNETGQIIRGKLLVE